MPGLCASTAPVRRMLPSGAPNNACCLLRVAEDALVVRAGCCELASGARLGRRLLAMRLSRASVLGSKLLCSLDIYGW